MDLTEKTLDSREVFRGRIIRVRQDTVRLPNGKEGTREVVEHPGGVAVLAIDDEGRVLLVRQCMDGTLTDAKTVAAILKGKILRAQ